MIEKYHLLLKELPPPPPPQLKTSIHACKICRYAGRQQGGVHSWCERACKGQLHSSYQHPNVIIIYTSCAINSLVFLFFWWWKLTCSILNANIILTSSTADRELQLSDTTWNALYTQMSIGGLSSFPAITTSVTHKEMYLYNKIIKSHLPPASDQVPAEGLGHPSDAC